MDADGTKDGYDIEMIEAVREHVTVPVIACGGAGRLADFAAGRRGGRRRGPGRVRLPLRGSCDWPVKDALRAAGHPVR